LQFLANVPDLAVLLPDGSGRINSSGRLSLASGQPFLKLQLRGSALEFGDYSLDGIEVVDLGGREAGALAHLALTVEGLDVEGFRAEQLESEVLVGRSIQQLSISTDGSGLELSAALQGSFTSAAGSAWFEAPASALSWNGEVGEFHFADTDRLAVDLLAPAALKWSDGRLSLGNFCLSTGGASSLCLQAERLGDSSLEAGLVMEQLPLAVVQPFVQSEFGFDHLVSGRLRGAWSPGLAPSASADLQISPGKISFIDEAEVLVTTGPGLLAFELGAGRLNSGRFDLPLEGLGKIDLDFGMENLAAGTDALVEGRLYLSLQDLEPLAQFIPGVDEAGGRLEADLGLSGTLERPILQGSAAIEDGMIENFPLGLRLSEISLISREIGGGRTELEGSFKAREGTGRITAVLDASDFASPAFEVNLRADRLTIFDAPDLRLVARPNIDFGWRNGALEIGGSLEIPEARLVPKQMPASSVSESPDRVIIAGELPGTADEGGTAYQARIFGSLDLELGDQVELDLSLAVAKLTGKTRFDWSGGAEPSANGQFRMDGQIQAFGQLMRITDGRISWRDTLASNPFLNIRAERDIFGNSEIRRAGVFVTGNVRRLVVEPFTDPMTNRVRARTLLLTGSDFNMEKGVGAVGIGTYIAPRLFVSYGIGVFEDENVISIRYDLGRNWGVKATSGQRGTGIDMSYTIER
jgi:translocation and assembly module TamB